MTTRDPVSPPNRNIDSAPNPRTERGTGLFGAYWRWHFYASVLVIPILGMLAITGLIYLLRFQIEPLLHRDLMVLSQPAGMPRPVPLSAQQDAVATAYPTATIRTVTEPGGPDRSTSFSVELPDGAGRDVFVDPWSGRVLGDLDPDSTLSGLAIRVHSELLAGRWGDHLIELGACWAIVLTVTGYLLFWRGRRARRTRLARRVRSALLRNRHAWVGAIVGGGILLLILTGLPWTGIWGERVQQLATDRGTSLWSEDHGALSDPASTLDESLPHSHRAEIPWGAGKSEVPTSAATSDGAVANLDTAVTVAVRAGVTGPMTVALPTTDEGVYSVIGYAFNDPGQERTIHVDRYSGQVVSEYGYGDYPTPAKVVAQGIAVHEGRRFGVLNFWLTFAFCLSVIFLCVSGPLMWWRRRPARSGLAAPRGRLPIATTWWIAAAVVALAVLLPLFGASLLVVLLVDRFLIRRIAPLRRWFNVSP
ncbi:MAG: PepSY domain-containing protein [Actinomycetota bacterium]|nr:MAG: PepSY domain-containing protein [Actinomycetota bacterium]